MRNTVQSMTDLKFSFSERRTISEAYCRVMEAEGGDGGVGPVASKALNGALLGAAGGAVAGTLGHFFGRRRKKESIIKSALGGAAMGGALGGAVGAGMGYFGGKEQSGQTADAADAAKAPSGHVGTPQTVTPHHETPDRPANTEQQAMNGGNEEDTSVRTPQDGSTEANGRTATATASHAEHTPDENGRPSHAGKSNTDNHGGADTDAPKAGQSIEKAKKETRDEQIARSSRKTPTEFARHRQALSDHGLDNEEYLGRVDKMAQDTYRKWDAEDTGEKVKNVTKAVGKEAGIYTVVDRGGKAVGRRLVRAGNALDGTPDIPKETAAKGGTGKNPKAERGPTGKTAERNVKPAKQPQTPKPEGRPSVPKEARVKTGKAERWSPPPVEKGTKNAAGNATRKASEKAAEKTAGRAAVTASEKVGAKLLRGAGNLASHAAPLYFTGRGALDTYNAYNKGDYDATVKNATSTALWGIPGVGWAGGLAYDTLDATGALDKWNNHVQNGGTPMPEGPVTQSQLADIKAGKYDHPLIRVGDYVGDKLQRTFGSKDQDHRLRSGKANPTLKRVGPTVYNARKLDEQPGEEEPTWMHLAPRTVESVRGSVTEDYDYGDVAPEITACRNARSASKMIRNAVEPYIHGLFDDMSWENVTAVYNVLVDKLGLPVEWTVKNDSNHHAGYSLDGRSKAWDVEIHFVNDYGRRIDLYGTLATFAAGTVGRPWSRYDMAFTLDPA